MALTNFDTATIGQRAIPAATAIFAPISAFSFKVEGASRLNTVKVPIIGAVADGAEFNASSNNYFTDSATDDSTKSVILNLNPKSTFKYSIAEVNHMTEATMQAKWASAIAGAAKTAMNNVFAKVLSSIFTNTALDINVASFDGDSLIDLRATLQAATGTTDQRLSFIGNSALITALKKDSTLRTLFAQAGIIDPVSGSRLPIVDNTQIFQASVPTNSQTLQGFICDTSCLAVAFGYEEYAEAEGFSSTVVTDPVSGISMMLHEEREPGTKDIYFTAEVLQGVVEADIKSLVRVIDTP